MVCLLNLFGSYIISPFFKFVNRKFAICGRLSGFEHTRTDMDNRWSLKFHRLYDKAFLVFILIFKMTVRFFFGSAGAKKKLGKKKTPLRSFASAEATRSPRP